MQRVINALTNSLKIVGALLFIYLMFFVPLGGYFKFTSTTFNVFKMLVVIGTCVLLFSKTSDTS